MKHDREARELLLDGLQHVECEGRRDQTAGLRVAGALLRRELAIKAQVTSSGTKAPLAKIAFTFTPKGVSFFMAALNISPVEICSKPYFS